MNKVVLGAALGIAAGYVAKKMYDKGYFDEAGDELNKMAAKAKKTAKNAWAKGQNEAEYIKDRAEHTIQKGKDTLNEISY